MKPCWRAPGSAAKRPNVIGWDGGPPTTGARHLKLNDDLTRALSTLADAKKDRRSAEDVGECTVAHVDAVREAEDEVARLRSEIASLDSAERSGGTP